MNIKLKKLIEELSNSTSSISDGRQRELDEIAEIITNQLKAESTIDIVVVCTHNSRRSQLGEVWINTLADHFDLTGIMAFSGGMEDTAFNYRMVNALLESGFDLELVEDGTNPKYRLNESNNEDQLMFSKAHDHPMNPTSNYMALMVCDHADENCPIVFGMKYRIPLRYKDPKEFDDTEKETEAYNDKVIEIGREIYYLLNRVSSLL